MNAWIDCMSELDDAEAGMTAIHAKPGEVVVLQLDHVSDFSMRCPELYEGIVEGAAFVNWRRIETGQNAVLALSFCKRD